MASLPEISSPIDVHSEQRTNRNERNRKRGKKLCLHDQESGTKKQLLSASRVQIDDRDGLQTYYETAFVQIKAINCIFIIKAFIRRIEPRKQWFYPYGGSRPPWWPASIRHRTPTYLLQSERIQLLIHILRGFGESHSVTAQMLREESEHIRKFIKPPENFQILEEVFSVRIKEELYLSGKIDSNSMVSIARVKLG